MTPIANKEELKQQQKIAKTFNRTTNKGVVVVVVVVHYFYVYFCS